MAERLPVPRLQRWFSTVWILYRGVANTVRLAGVYLRADMREGDSFHGQVNLRISHDEQRPQGYIHG